MSYKKTAFAIVFTLCTCFLALADAAYAATFALTPTTKSVDINEQFTLNVSLDTKGVNTDGADAIITYDPAYLAVVSASLGSIYDTPVTTNTSTDGKVILSAVSSAGSYYQGNGILATITFKALQAGNTDINFTYTSGSTTDSNITSNQEDLLDSVAGSTITIASKSYTGAYQAPESGSTELTTWLGIIGVGGLFLAWLTQRQTA